MTGSTKVTTTTTDGWDKACMAWAKAGEHFEILGIKANHLAFCKELCDLHGYECHYQADGQLKAVFTPLSS